MNAMNWNTLSWGKLTDPAMAGKDILIVYYSIKPTRMDLWPVKILGTSHIDNEHVLLVEREDDEDTYIITREFKGRNWEAYEILEGF